MKVFPAINIKNGHCVKLWPCQYYDAELLSYSPGKVAREWEEQGASMLHVVDVDGALAGHIVNGEAIKKLIKEVTIPVEVGGGIRSIKEMEMMLHLGASKVVIGTKAVGNPGFIRDVLQLFGAEQVVVAIDAKNGMVVVEGWEKVSHYNAVALAIKMRDLGVQTITYSDITRDGLQLGPNLEHIKEMVKATNLNIILSGGITSLKDLEMVFQIPVYGSIIDRALYEKRINLKEAIELFEREEK